MKKIKEKLQKFSKIRVSISTVGIILIIFYSATIIIPKTVIIIEYILTCLCIAIILAIATVILYSIFQILTFLFKKIKQLKNR